MFISYELYEGTEFWSDHITWEDEIFAQVGLKDFLNISIAKNLLFLVQNGYSSSSGQLRIPSQGEQSNRFFRRGTVEVQCTLECRLDHLCIFTS